MTHIDGTGRVQTVQETKQKFYNLIEKFYQLSNVPIYLILLSMKMNQL